MQRHLSFVASFIFGLLALFAMTIFTVDQRQFAIIFQLGEIKEVVSEPGLTFKWPLIQNVRIFDKRILTLDAPEPERFLTAEKKPVLVDSFVKWRIHDVKQYYVSVGGDETLAKTRLSQTVNAGLREEFGRRTVHDVVSGARDDIMVVVKKKADTEMRAIGVEIVDDAIELPSFRHPRQAAYILGAERTSLPPAILEKCAYTVRIPTQFSINVGLAGALVMYDRLTSLGRFPRRPMSPRGVPEPVPEHVYGDPRFRTRTARFKIAPPDLSETLGSKK